MIAISVLALRLSLLFRLINCSDRGYAHGATFDRGQADSLGESVCTILARVGDGAIGECLGVFTGHPGQPGP